MTESQARNALVDYGRALWDRRLVTGTSGNLSMRLSDGDLLVTPANRSLGHLRTGELVRTDGSGTPRSATQRPSSELPLHIAAYRVRSDIAVVMHAHPTFCVVWSKFREPLPRDTVGARETLGEVAWTPYRPPGTSELAQITAAEFAKGINTVIMERHGVSTVGPTLEDAMMLTDLVEEAARIAYFSRLAFGESSIDRPR
ncbi:MAG: class II aldolase/adducin family protein [Vulcanimicrobiaceae bacterium]